MVFPITKFSTFYDVKQINCLCLKIFVSNICSPCFNFIKLSNKYKESDTMEGNNPRINTFNWNIHEVSICH